MKVSKSFPRRGGLFQASADYCHAVREVSFELRQGETLGLVGESGCGKTTLARMIARIETPTAGSILYKGADIFSPGNPNWHEYRKKTQFIFQDPYASLNPRLSAGEIVSEPFVIHCRDTAAAAAPERLLEMVGLSPEHQDRYPHEFSGGQRQRIGIARALALQPEIIIADEPVSALDVSVQAQILNLLKDLQASFNLSYIFISHDMGVIRFMSDRVAVMYGGSIMEMGSNEQLFSTPQHPYTRLLMDAVPRLDKATGTRGKRNDRNAKDVLAGSDGQGCPFFPRCPETMAVCRNLPPELHVLTGEHLIACHQERKTA